MDVEEVNEMVDMIKEIAGSNRELQSLTRQAMPYFEGSKDLAMNIQSIYGMEDVEERKAGLHEILTHFLATIPPAGKLPEYIENLQIQTSFCKPYLILFKCEFAGTKAFGKLFIMSNDDVRNKYATELRINTVLLGPLLADTQNIPRLLHVDEAVDGRLFYEAVKGHLLEKHRKWLEGSLSAAAPAAPHAAHLLLYEDVGEHPLQTYINKLSDVDLRKTLVQLFATTYFLHERGICHGDLYGRTNIMLRKLDVPKTIEYRVGSVIYRVPDIRWMLTIIDFDLASAYTDACEDYAVVTESIQKARIHAIEFPDSLGKAIAHFGEPFAIAAPALASAPVPGGKRRTRKVQKAMALRKTNTY